MLHVDELTIVPARGAPYDDCSRLDHKACAFNACPRCRYVEAEQQRLVNDAGQRSHAYVHRVDAHVAQALRLGGSHFREFYRNREFVHTEQI
jgi:hypothetical protein